jgi:F-box-like
LLVEPTNDKSEAESPVFRLPTELTRLIFRECRSDIRLRLTVTHICHRWREIAVNDPSLWTSIRIRAIHEQPNLCLDGFLSFLSMQLDRTANQLLDVEWTADIREASFVAILQWIRRKAPFSRWRALELYICGRSPDGSPWSTFDAFPNLKSLYISNGTESSILRVIDSTITSHLEVLDLSTWDADWLADMMEYFTRPFSHVSSLYLSTLPSTRHTPLLPANIVNLRLCYGTYHLFPHILTYRPRNCAFIESSVINLGNMTTLIVNGHLRVACQVFFPALRQLTMRSLWMDTDGRIEAPALNTLHLKHDPDTRLLSTTDNSLLSPGYLLSPNTSIMAGLNLPKTAVLNLLAKSPKVTHATLRFEDWA